MFFSFCFCISLCRFRSIISVAIRADIGSPHFWVMPLPFGCAGDAVNVSAFFTSSHRTGCFTHLTEHNFSPFFVYTLMDFENVKTLSMKRFFCYFFTKIHPLSGMFHQNWIYDRLCRAFFIFRYYTFRKEDGWQ